MRCKKSPAGGRQREGMQMATHPLAGYLAGPKTRDEHEAEVFGIPVRYTVEEDEDDAGRKETFYVVSAVQMGEVWVNACELPDGLIKQLDRGVREAVQHESQEDLWWESV